MRLGPSVNGPRRDEALARHPHLPRLRGGARHLRRGVAVQRGGAAPQPAGDPAGQPGLPPALPGRGRAGDLPHQPGARTPSGCWTRERGDAARPHPPGAPVLPAADVPAAGRGDGPRRRRSSPSRPWARCPSSRSWRRASSELRRRIRRLRPRGGGRLHGAGDGAPGPGAGAPRRPPSCGRWRPPSAGSCASLRAALDSRIRERVDGAEERERRTGLAIIALSVLAIGVGLGGHGLCRRARCAPCAPSSRACRASAAATTRAQLGVRGDDEVAVLAREFDAMARSLQAREAQLKAQAEALAARRAARGRGPHLRAGGPRGAQSPVLHRPQRGAAGGRAWRAPPSRPEEAREATRAARRGHPRGGPAHRGDRAVPAHGAPAPAHARRRRTSTRCSAACWTSPARSWSARGVEVVRELRSGHPAGAGRRGAAAPGVPQPAAQQPRGHGRAAAGSPSPRAGWRTGRGGRLPGHRARA